MFIGPICLMVYDLPMVFHTVCWSKAEEVSDLLFVEGSTCVARGNSRTFLFKTRKAFLETLMAILKRLSPD